MEIKDAVKILDNCAKCSSSVDQYLPPTLGVSVRDVHRQIAYAISDHQRGGHETTTA